MCYHWENIQIADHKRNVFLSTNSFSLNRYIYKWQCLFSENTFEKNIFLQFLMFGVLIKVNYKKI